MSQQEAKWYVVHTYSGYENKVKEDLEKSVENAGLSDIILEVKYPTEETIEILPTGKRKTTTRKVFPGYVMVKMLVDVVVLRLPVGRISMVSSVGYLTSRMMSEIHRPGGEAGPRASEGQAHRVHVRPGHPRGAGFYPGPETLIQRALSSFG